MLHTHTPLTSLFNTCRKSASCTHISALLHALAAMTPVAFPAASSTVADDEDANSVPLPCRWKPPRKQKESNLMLHLRNMYMDKQS